MTQLPDQGFQNTAMLRGASRPPVSSASGVIVNGSAASYNFDAGGNLVADEIEITVKKKIAKGGLIKLLILLMLPMGLAAAVALFFITNTKEASYRSARNVVMTIPMRNVNWQDLGVIFEPIVPLEIKTLAGYESWEFLLDSGAVVSSLPRDWADKMGKDLTMMQRSTFRGFGNVQSFAYQGDMTVKIGGEDVVIPVVFTEAAGTKSLLGRKGFFQNFSVYFNSAENQIEIRK